MTVYLIVNLSEQAQTLACPDRFFMIWNVIRPDAEAGSLAASTFPKSKGKQKPREGPYKGWRIIKNATH